MCALRSFGKLVVDPRLALVLHQPVAHLMAEQPVNKLPRGELVLAMLLQSEFCTRVLQLCRANSATDASAVHLTE